METRKLVNLCFTYFLSKVGQLSGDGNEIFRSQQYCTGDIKLSSEEIKNIELDNNGSIESITLTVDGLQFDKIQTVESLYQEYLTHPGEIKGYVYQKV